MFDQYCIGHVLITVAAVGYEAILLWEWGNLLDTHDANQLPLTTIAHC